jgi:hypothetical protein
LLEVIYLTHGEFVCELRNDVLLERTRRRNINDLNGRYGKEGAAAASVAWIVDKSLVEGVLGGPAISHERNVEKIVNIKVDTNEDVLADRVVVHLRSPSSIDGRIVKVVFTAPD